MKRSRIQTFVQTFCVTLSLILGLLGCGYHSLMPSEVYNPEEHPDHRVELASVQDSIALYQMMKDLHEVFKKCDVPYWIDSGTGLGAIRNAGIIPWDDDLDCALLKKDEHRFLVTRPILDQLGYSIEKAFFGHRVINQEGGTPQLDIFLMNEVSGKFYYDAGDWGSRDDGPIYITPAEVFPLKEIDFGPIRVMAPNDPGSFMDAMFRGWRDIAYSYGHAGQRKFKIDLKKYDYFKRPAPLNPETFEVIDIRHELQDRVPSDLKCPALDKNSDLLPFPDYFDGV